jgi:hypothetical protein
MSLNLFRYIAKIFIALKNHRCVAPWTSAGSIQKITCATNPWAHPSNCMNDEQEYKLILNVIPVVESYSECGLLYRNTSELI